MQGERGPPGLPGYAGEPGEKVREFNRILLFYIVSKNLFVSLAKRRCYTDENDVCLRFHVQFIRLHIKIQAFGNGRQFDTANLQFLKTKAKTETFSVLVFDKHDYSS